MMLSILFDDDTRTLFADPDPARDEDVATDALDLLEVGKLDTGGVSDLCRSLTDPPMATFFHHVIGIGTRPRQALIVHRRSSPHRIRPFLRAAQSRGRPRRHLHRQRPEAHFSQRPRRPDRQGRHACRATQRQRVDCRALPTRAPRTPCSRRSRCYGG